MKSLTSLVLVALVSLTSCEKTLKQITDFGQRVKAGKATPAAPTAAPGKAAASEIPQLLRDRFELTSHRVVMVDYCATWCGPCRSLSPVLEKLAAEQPEVMMVCKVDVDQFKEVAMQEQVHAIPDVRIYVDGKLASKFVGALPESELRQRLAELQLPAKPVAAAVPAKRRATAEPMAKDWMPPGLQRTNRRGQTEEPEKRH